MELRHWWLIALVIPVCFVMACTKHNPAASCPDGICKDPAYPFCDSHGVIDGEPQTCIAVSCTPMQFKACDGSNAIVCNGTGNDYDVNACEHGCNATSGCNECTPGATSCGSGVVNQCGQDGHWSTLDTCALDCVDSPAPHCAYIQPKYLPDVCDMPATQAELHITQNGTMDTDLDATCTGGVVNQTGGPALCVVRYGTITIDSTATLKVVSSANQNKMGPGRGVALVADGDLTVAGALDVSADGVVSGPGGGTIASGGPIGTPSGAGGGGAGFKTKGAAGGTITTDGGAGNGGVASMDPALLTAMIGGPHSPGGGGGGAAILVSCRGKVNVGGVIDAGGGGGAGGFYYLSAALPGGGGGAGGYVVLQGLDVSVTGEMYANGGGGGAGCAGDGTGCTIVSGSSTDGQDGLRSESLPAAGGQPPTGAGAGGAGGVLGIAQMNPTGGKHPTATGDTAGGGGGSVGFFQSYTPAGVTPTLTPSHASPKLQANGTIPTR